MTVLSLAALGYMMIDMCVFDWLCVQLIESRITTLHTAVQVSSELDLVCIVLP